MRSWCFICVHGCHTARSERATQSSVAGVCWLFRFKTTPWERLVCIALCSAIRKTGGAPDHIHASHDGLRFSRKLRTPSRPSSEARIRAMRSAVSADQRVVDGFVGQIDDQLLAFAHRVRTVCRDGCGDVHRRWHRVLRRTPPDARGRCAALRLHRYVPPSRNTGAMRVRRSRGSRTARWSPASARALPRRDRSAPNPPLSRRPLPLQDPCRPRMRRPERGRSPVFCTCRWC